MTARTTIQLRRGTAAQWTAANPTLAAGEFGVETDTGKRKVGDGSTAWASLPYSVLSNDSRLTDTRTPTDNSVTSAKIVDGAIVNADINASAAIDLSKLATQADQTFVGNRSGGVAAPSSMTAAQAWAVLSGTAAANVSLNSKKLTSVAAGSATGDVATYEQVILSSYGGKEVYQSHGNTGATETIDLSNGNVHAVTQDQSCTYTFSGATNSTGCSFLLMFTSVTGTATWPASVKWPDGVAPTLSAASILSFVTVDGGTTWYGALVGKAFA